MHQGQAGVGIVFYLSHVISFLKQKNEPETHTLFNCSVKFVDRDNVLFTFGDLLKNFQQRFCFCFGQIIGNEIERHLFQPLLGQVFGEIRDHSFTVSGNDVIGLDVNSFFRQLLFEPTMLEGLLRG